MGKNLLSLFIFAVSTFVSLSVFSQTILISDVDDTLKSSHVLNKTDALRNTVQLRNHFYGMGELYTIVQETNPEINFFYLSAAPEALMEKLHAAFLTKNGFPAGELILRKKLSDKEFKLKAIRSIIETHQPQKVILIGDNGERDPYIYEQARSEYPNIQFDIYIHQVYSYRARKEIGVPQQSGHILFVTSIDLARAFIQSRDLDQSELDPFALDTIPEFFKQDPKKELGPLFIPSWVDCRDFFKIENLKPTTWNLDPSWASETTRSADEWLMAYDQKLSARCSNGPKVKSNRG